MKLKFFAKIIAVSMSALMAFSPVFAFADGESAEDKKPSLSSPI